MKTSDFYYDLPKELIAQEPAEKRDASRLLVYDRASGEIRHRVFSDCVEYMRPGDALVINETKVIPARLLGVREDTGAKMEFLLLNRKEGDVWEALAKPAKKAVRGSFFRLGEGGEIRAEVLGPLSYGGRLIKLYYDGPFEAALDAAGRAPLPPYIRNENVDKARYQTVYASREGSAAAPTAGLHFTDELLEKIAAKGVNVVRVLLHVGLGTFRPVKAENVEEHVMHEEYFEISPEAAKAINAARASGGKVIAVGTTSVRALESAWGNGGVQPQKGRTGIFIYPGYEFRAVDCLITNFHLPESTLLMLVSAFMGREEALRAYRIAVEERYRFFSFGDAMMIL